MKNKRLQFVVVVFLLILLPILLYLLQQVLSLRGRAAGEASLRLVPRNIAQTPEGRWQLPVDQEVKVDVVLESGSYRVETIDASIIYDPTVVTLVSPDPTHPSTDNIICSNFTPLQYEIISNIGGVTINEAGVEQGTERGFASVLCSAVPLLQPDALYTPPPVGFSAPVATFTFKTKKVATEQSITFDFTPETPINDSAILSYEGPCCSTTDVLQSVGNLTFDVVEPQEKASLSLSPSSGLFVKGQPFEVQVNLTTGQYTVDSVDGVITYDKTALKALEVKEGLIFTGYRKTPATGINEATGTIDITGQIAPNGQGIKGDNLLFATITFEPLVDNIATGVNFKFNSANLHSDSNISQFHTGTDVLSSVVNASYQLSAVGITPSPIPQQAGLSLEPVSVKQVVGKSFDVAIKLSTGSNRTDSTDVVIEYDKTKLKALEVLPGSVFAGYTKIPPGSGINESGEMGRIQISGQIEPGTNGVTGTDMDFATIRFVPIAPIDSTIVKFVFDGIGAKNDSNIGQFGTGVDLLRVIQNADFRIVGSKRIVKSITFKIALQGRPHATDTKKRDVRLKILTSFFENNPLSFTTDQKGEIELSNVLEDKVEPGTFTMLLKPAGYIQRRFTTTLVEETNMIDLTDNPFKGGDFDGSGQVNSLDWNMFRFAFGKNDELIDLDGSGEVTALDNTYILLNWFGEDE